MNNVFYSCPSEIPLGLEGADDRIEAWIRLLEALGKAGVPALGWNYKPMGNFRTPSATGRGGVSYSTFDYGQFMTDRPDPHEPEVTEDLPLEPLTDYSKFKVICEQELEEEREPGIVTCTIRPSTVCGYAPRLRLDLTVNILTNHAINNGKITVFGGQQKRPNIHIDDMVDLYLLLLLCPAHKIDGQVFNAGYENHSVMEIAELVRGQVGVDVDIQTVPTDDHRSYHISSDAIRRELGFEPRRTIEDAVNGLVDAFGAGKIPNPMTDDRYYNLKVMQAVDLK